jgi:hypothetical protein
MAYTTQQMAAAAEQHYNQANSVRNGTPGNMLSSIAESLCGLLAMQLAAYASEPLVDDYDDSGLDTGA